MKRNLTRMLALLLAMVFALGLIPVAFAEREDRDSDSAYSIIAPNVSHDAHLSAADPTEPAAADPVRKGGFDWSVLFVPAVLTVICFVLFRKKRR